ncbi:MAG: hypothetical protein R2758_01810 [Bacteroidales bacterium]
MMYSDEESRGPEYISETVGYTPAGDIAEAHFIIRLFDTAELKGSATVVTTRAGIHPRKNSLSDNQYNTQPFNLEESL